MKLFKYLGKYWYAILAALLLLVVQANSDLSLPSITSDIVDVGIQQGGLEEVAPDKIRASTLSAIELFMTDAEKKAINENYKETTETINDKKVTVYKLDLQKGTTKEDLSKIFELPMFMLASSQSSSAKTESSAKSILTEYQTMSENGQKAKELGEQAKTLAAQAQTAGAKSQAAAASGDVATAQSEAQKAQTLGEQAKEAGAQAQTLANEIQTTSDAMPAKVLAARKETKSELGDLGEDSLKTVGIQVTLAEYKALKVNTKSIQTDYMVKKGTEMVLLTFISALASILVGLIAAVVSSAVGKHLRERQFKKVLQFSNAEMDKFSAASLITRSTNDIQQIQLGLVMIIRLVLYAPILGLGGIYHVYKTGTGMGWIIGVAVGAVLLLVLTLLGTTMPKFKSLQNLVDRVNLVSREILTGLPVIRAFSREKYEENRFDRANKDLM